MVTKICSCSICLIIIIKRIIHNFAFINVCYYSNICYCTSKLASVRGFNVWQPGCLLKFSCLPFMLTLRMLQVNTAQAFSLHINNTQSTYAVLLVSFADYTPPTPPISSFHRLPGDTLHLTTSYHIKEEGAAFPSPSIRLILIDSSSSNQKGARTYPAGCELHPTGSWQQRAAPRRSRAATIRTN